ncbi:uncharacterized protein LOC141596842 [Silene latifolia]|uniref:uncharacterized protein LOC141596842 n=1 Tax=Silene latifolia TaxID=37657 RepID=UPI003D78658E
MLMASKNRDKKCITEPPPKMLKEFLQELNNNNNNNNNPRRHPNTLPRTRSSRSRAAVTSFQKLISSAIKSLRRGSSTSSLPRSLSTSLLDRFSFSKKNRYTSNNDNRVKVKDILRWRSSRDLVEEASQPLDYSPVTASVDDERISIATSSDSSNLFGSESSLGEKEESCFTADELPCWWGNSCEESKLWDQDNDVVATVSYVGSKEELDNMNMEDGKEQHSPVSVLNSPFREEIDSPFSEQVSDEEFVSSFDKSLANMERTKQRLLQSIRSFENLAGVFEDDDETDIEEVVQEQEDEIRKVDDEIEVKSREYLSRAIGKITWRSQAFKDREGSIKYMEEEQEQWSKFEEEKRELGVELEVQVLSDLVNEVLIDHFG